jgi:hypothetical protein
MAVVGDDRAFRPDTDGAGGTRGSWRNVLKLATLTLAVALAFLGGVWFASSLREPSTCARVPNGIVCWHGITRADWAVR